MFRSLILYRTLIAAAGLTLLASCADTTPPPQVAAIDAPQLAGAWYQVYFDSDAAEINARGQMIIQTIANVAKNDSKVTLSVIGKTDRIGDAASNTALSQRRADRVRDALIAQAVPANRIHTSWTGQGKQESATTDKAAEQRNRVVDITVEHSL
jgi:peptidoglycan-associated lipoprotein